MSNFLKYLVICIIWLAQSSYAVLKIELTKGIRAAIPIAVVPFAGQQLPDIGVTNLADIIHHDLYTSGHFNILNNDELSQAPSEVSNIKLSYWRTTNADDLVIGHVEATGNNQYRVQFSLIAIFGSNSNVETPSQSQVLASKVYVVPAQQLRLVAHKISDIIYQQLTATRGIFTTKIAYVERDKLANGHFYHKLMVADVDGFNPTLILGSNQPIMSPAWSPNGKRLAYVSFEKGHSQIYISDVKNGQRQLVSTFPGINGAPAFSPSGNQLALVLSKSGYPKIYIKNLVTGKLKQLTYGQSIDTEPKFSPNGKNIIFTSDRSGGPQIYQLALATNKLKRITYNGFYNSSASFSKDGMEIVYIHRNEDGFNIAKMNLLDGNVSLITKHSNDESPTLAPNGKLVLYASHRGDRSVLEVASTNDEVSYRLPTTRGDTQEPAWSPYLT